MKPHFVLLPLVAALTACGGSDNSTAPVTPYLPKMISGELSNLNKVTGDAKVGSRAVNLNNAAITRATSLDNLHNGMMLTLTTDGKDTVNSWVYDELLQAPVSFNDGKMLKVAGFTVIVPKGTDLSLYQVTQMVEVSGFMLDGNTIQATYLNTEEEEVSSDIEGMVSRLNGTKTQFNIGNVLITLPSAMNELKEGVWVEAEGIMTFTEQNNELTELKIDNATVDIDTPDYPDVEGNIELEGRINWVAPDFSHLVINQNQSVTILSSTQFEDGEKNQLQPGQLIEVEGNWNHGSMSLEATEIEFDGLQDMPINLPEFEAQGYADYNVDTHIISFNGINFIISPHTQFEGNNINAKVSFTGQWVELSGYEQAGQYLVQEVEQDNDELDDTRVELEGLVRHSAEKNETQILGYKVIDDSLNAYITQRVEVECLRTTDNQLHNCLADND